MSLLSIDPGINFCGLSVGIYDNSYKVLECSLVKNIRKLTEEEKALEKKRGIRVVKIKAIIDKVYDLVSRHSVDTIVVEAPFYNSLTPMAYGSILEVLFSIKYTVVMELDLQFEVLEPLLIKKLFTDKSFASKDVMKSFLKTKIQSNDISIGSIDFDSLSEHEVDAIAIGYVYSNMSKAASTPTTQS